MTTSVQPINLLPATPRRNLGAALLLTGLLTALVAIGSSLAARIVPSWQPAVLPAACVLVAVEAALVRYRMRSGRHLELGALSYLAAELCLLGVLMRATATLSLGVSGPLVTSLERYIRAPLAVFDLPFWLCLIIGLAVALLMRGGLNLLAQLDPRAPVRASGLDGEIFRVVEAQGEREALGRLASNITWGGALALLGLVGLVADVDRLGGPAIPLPPAPALAGVIYLLCAILLYSWGRLALLGARWARDEAAVEQQVAVRWRWASLGLVAVVALLGLLLPGGYGAPLLAAAQGGLIAVINLVTLVALFLGAIAVGALGLILAIPAFILALLPRTVAQPTTATPPPLPPPTPTPALPTEAPLAPGLIFWACVAVLVGYALWTVVRRQQWAIALGQRLRQGRLGRALAWFGALFAGIAGYARVVAEAVGERLRPQTPPEPPQPLPRRGPLGPAELIRFCYRAALSRAARVGLGRGPAETPYEYASRLRADLPEAAEAVDGLTERYVEAAYSSHAATPEEARRARGLWARLKRALQRWPR